MGPVHSSGDGDLSQIIRSVTCDFLNHDFEARFFLEVHTGYTTATMHDLRTWLARLSLKMTIRLSSVGSASVRSRFLV